MPQTVSSVEASGLRRISRQALVAPLTITHHGHDSLVLMSAAEYQRLKRRDREVFTLTVPEEIVEGFERRERRQKPLPSITRSSPDECKFPIQFPAS
jgi:PHD/YefM family antitoxin component YafN of YafNO toxin-antitoxin module